MDDSTAGFPEADTVLGPGGGQEVVDLLVDVLGPGKVLVPLNLGLDQMVTVDCAGDCNFGKSRADELKHRHLSCGVLERGV